MIRLLKPTAAALVLTAALPACAGPGVSATPTAAAAPAPFASERMTVEVRGAGPDVVLIPGLTSSRSVWARTAADLEKDHRVHLVQVSGFGGQPAGANKEGLVVAPLVEELARYIRTRGLNQPAVIGHSLGGEAALMLAQRHPDLPGRIMIVDALPFFALLMNPAATPETVRPQADMARDAMLAMTPEVYAASQKAGLVRLVKSPQGRERAAADSVASDPSVVARAMHEIIVTDLRPDFPKVKAPVTVLYAYDPSYGRPAAAADELYAKAYAGLAGAKLVRVDGSYHFIMDDQPERFDREVRAFLQ